MTPTAHRDLAARLEAAEGASRELDEAIMHALFDREERHIGAEEEQDDGSWAPVKDRVWVNRTTGKWVSTHALNFTSSLDAALTLLPEGGEWSRHRGANDRMTMAVWAPGMVSIYAQAATPALALAAAALRARAAMMEEQG
ncbi:hypothetical protein SAMN02745194_04521 [Roseomonas rosea]|uniref:Phage ABA sandwich domain-containing protein n=1 Tax=Muricoccus roseus TaxID=198092 RepID=A0A1M6QUG7_9PROT|nr:hypothetical protein [Roseomonas rosea]SHK23846.1 hypothetical protein SAMN02745194_04521 [Roseomonas rosea]